MAGDALESNSGQFFGVVNVLWCWGGVVIFSLQGKGAVLKNKKGQSGRPDCPEKGIKKGTLSLIGQCAVKKIRLPLIKWSVSLALEHRPALGKRQAFSYSTEAFLAC